MVEIQRPKYCFDCTKLFRTRLGRKAVGICIPGRFYQLETDGETKFISPGTLRPEKCDLGSSRRGIIKAYRDGKI